MDVLDRKYFSIKQVGSFLLAVIAFTAVWAWRVAITHYEFELLKATTELNDANRRREDSLIRQIHSQDDIRTNERIDKKTARIEEKIDKDDKE